MSQGYRVADAVIKARVGAYTLRSKANAFTKSVTFVLAAIS